jgi:hypothetical protein
MARRLELSFENGQEPWGRAGQGGAAAKLPHRLGLAIGCLGLWFLSHLTAQSTHVDIVWRLVVTGLGQGLFQPPNNNAIMSSVPAHRVGIAAGFLATVRVLGQASSVTLSGAVFTMLGGAQAGVALSHNWGGRSGLFLKIFLPRPSARPYSPVWRWPASGS